MIAGDALHLPLSGDFMKMVPIGGWLVGAAWIARRANVLPAGLAAIGVVVDETTS
jgi:hypothetical protein